MTTSAFALLLAPLLAATGPTKVLVMPLSAGEGVNDGTAKAITASVVGEVRRRPGLAVLTSEDVQAVVSVDRQRQMLGCTESSCLAELGGALGVAQVITGSVARLGASWLIHLQVIDANKAVVLRQSDRRKKGGNIDDVLDELPGMVGELFGAAAPQPAPLPVGQANPTTTTPAPIAAAPITPAKLVPSGVDERAEVTAEVAKKLVVATDKNGHYLAFVPFSGLEGPLFAGAPEAMHAQYLGGGGSSGNTEFDVYFWEPRVRAPAESSFDFKNGAYTLTCGKKTIPFTALSAAEAKAFLKKASLMKPRWRRQGTVLGRDDDGSYYYVDSPRADDAPADDVHLYIGKKGQVVPVKVTDVQRAGHTLMLESDAGSIKLTLGDDEEALKTPGSIKSAAGVSKPITPLALWPNKGMIYTQLGAYAGQALGTACDPFL
ncbi:MAG: hypothetical protein JST54_21530 [Deltaproteobacteria bacterium]|nr:hypothetical protein [Deltaproteobacteria bacterium]